LGNVYATLTIRSLDDGPKLQTMHGQLVLTRAK
jgi:hypothetical protein